MSAVWAAALASFASLTIASGSSEAPEWTWKQVLSTPRIGGRLTSIGVDRDDPRRLFVGTEEGTVVRSLDGGITWRELELTQTVLKDRNLGLRQPGLPSLGSSQPPDFQIFIDPPNSPVAFRPALFFPTLFFSIKPEFVFAGFLPPPEPTGLDILGDAVASRQRYTVPVRRIAVCPGNLFSLLVATSREVYGSLDDGLTYVRLFGLPKDNITRVEASGVRRVGATIDNVICADRDPSRIAVATAIGLFLSKDGGLSWDQNLSGWPGQAATAVGYSTPQPGTTEPTLFYAAGQVLFAGDPDSSNGLQRVYPDFKNAATAPWQSIRWVATSGSGQVFLATDDGVRSSPDRGASWVAPSRLLFERQRVVQVEIGQTARGGERIAVLVKGSSSRGAALNTEDWVYSSDDGGDTWHPFFAGITRRSFSQIASAPDPGGGPTRWWVVTTGGVWASHTPQYVEPDRSVDAKAQRWARERLAKSPDLTELMTRMLDRTGVSSDQIEHLWTLTKASNWLPEINAEFTYRITDQAYDERSQPLTPFTRATTADRDDVSFFVNARWTLYWTTLAVERFTFPRRALHELRRQVGFLTEDAWHERHVHLTRLANGMSDPLQIETLKARIASLEAVLEVWLRGPLEET